MSSEELISAAMLQWEERWRQGDEPPVAELCADHPEFADKLKHEIAAIKGMSWLDEVDRIAVVDSPLNPLPRSGAGHLPASSLSVDEFAESICRSGLLTPEEMKKIQERSLDDTGDATSLAEKLVSDGRLTNYQASVVLEERSDPLLIDRYIILDTLGSGGMGLVFKALHKAMDRVVALKILPPWCVDSPDKVQRFQREAKAAAKLSHPNVVAVFDADQSDGTHFLAMEYVQGQNLHDYVRQHGPLRVGQAINWVIQAARGLEHAHQHGVIHRDIKPSNLMLTQPQATSRSVIGKGDYRIAPIVKVLDMGLALIDSPASLEQTAQDLTQGGILLGTIAYISPEQALDTRQADARSDVYSLGATLHFLLTGRPPYNEATAMKTLMAHREAPIPSLGEKRDDVPMALEAAYQRMLSKRPDDRLASMRELIETLEAITLDGDDESTWLPPMVVLDDDTDLVEMAGEETVALPHGGQTRGLSTALKSGGWRIVLGCLLVITLGAGGYSYFGTTLFKIDTTAGTLIVEVDQPGASVEVDGKRLTITQPGSKQPLTIDLDEGQHRLLVRKDGFDLFSKEITIDSGGRESVRVRLEPLSEATTIANVISAEQRALSDSWKPGPAVEVLPGLIPEPAKMPGIRRWQIETVDLRSSDHISLDWNPNAPLIACGMQYGVIQLCDAKTLGLVTCLVGHTGGVNDVAWHPDGTMLASAGGDGTIRIWSADGQQGPVLSGHSDVVTSVAWSPDGSMLASSSGDTTIRLWSPDGTPGPVLKGHTRKVNCVDWSPCGKQLASGSDDGTIQLWSDAGIPGRTIATASLGLVTRLVWSPNGEQIAATRLFQSRVEFWNVDGTEALMFDQHESYVIDLAWHPNGELMASGGADGTLRLWQSNGTLLKTITHPGYVRAVAWSPDGRRLVSTGSSGVICSWSFRGEKLRERSDDSDSKHPTLAWSPDGQTLACAQDNPSVIRLWNGDGTLRSTLGGHTSRVAAVAWSPTGELLATGSYDRTIRLWLPDGTSQAVLKGHSGMVRTVAWSPDGTQLASAGHDKTIRLWKADGTAGRVFMVPDDIIRSLTWGPDGNQLFSTGPGGKLRVWSPSDSDEDGKVAAQLGLQGNTLAFQPGGEWLAAGGAGYVRLLKPDGQLGLRLNVDLWQANSVAWSPDGKQFAVGDEGHWRSSKVQIWNVDGSPGEVFLHQGSSVGSLSWSLDGQQLAAADDDGTIRVWDAATRHTLWKTVLVGNDHVTIAPDGQLIEGDRDTLEEHFVYIVEHDDGRLESLKRSEFEKLATVSQKPAAQNVTWQATPEQQAFYDVVARLNTPAQIQAVAEKLRHINPGFKGTVEQVTSDGGATLTVRGGWFTDMWPLASLTNLTLDAEIGPETELLPLNGLPLTALTGVTLSPLNERADELVAALPRLKTINGVPAEAWLARRQDIEELAKILPTLAPRIQLDHVLEMLKEYNPGFDGELQDFKIEDNHVEEILFHEHSHFFDLSPLRLLRHLRVLKCDLPRVADLSPLEGMQLTYLDINNAGVTDLSPLRGMPLRRFHCASTRVSDLSPLNGMSLNALTLRVTSVSDLSPLEGMPLTYLHVGGTPVSDLSPLKDLPLETLSVRDCSQVVDLSPLQDMPLVSLNCRNSGISDFSVLKGLPLETITVTLFLFDDAQHDVLKLLPLKTINGFGEDQPAAEFWEQVAERRKAAEVFQAATASLPPEQQVTAVCSRLNEMNPDGSVTLKTVIVDGIVTTATLGGKPNDPTPLMAFTKLERLTFSNPDPGGWQYLDLSPISILPLKELICPDVIALGNAAILRKSETLQTINGQPAADYLDALRKSD